MLATRASRRLSGLDSNFLNRATDRRESNIKASVPDGLRKRWWFGLGHHGGSTLRSGFLASVAGSACDHRSALNDGVDAGSHVADIEVGSVPDDQVGEFAGLDGAEVGGDA